MTLTKEVQNQLFSAETNKLICLPPRTTYPSIVPGAPGAAGQVSSSPSASNNGTPWTEDEHARFLLGLEMFPSGPWKSIASIVGSRTARQTMSHAQKYRQKIARRQRGALVAQANAQSLLLQQQQQQQGVATFGDVEQDLLQQRFADQHIGAAASAAHGPFAHPAGSPAPLHGSPVSTLMSESLSDLHLSSEQIDEIITSLFEEDDSETLVLTGEDMEAFMSAE